MFVEKRKNFSPTMLAGTLFSVSRVNASKTKISERRIRKFIYHKTALHQAVYSCENFRLDGNT